MRYLSHCSSLHGTVVNTLILKYNPVAPLNLRFYDVIGHLTTLYAIFNFRYVPYWSWHKFDVRTVALTVLELLAFNAHKITGSRDSSHAFYSKIFSGIMSGLSVGARLPNLKFISLAILELLTFNAPNLRVNQSINRTKFQVDFAWVRELVGPKSGVSHCLSSSPLKLLITTVQHCDQSCAML